MTSREYWMLHSEHLMNAIAAMHESDRFKMQFELAQARHYLMEALSGPAHNDNLVDQFETTCKTMLGE